MPVGTKMALQALYTYSDVLVQSRYRFWRYLTSIVNTRNTKWRTVRM
jgi:hypothetical protein